MALSDHQASASINKCAPRFESVTSTPNCSYDRYLEVPDTFFAALELHSRRVARTFARVGPGAIAAIAPDPSTAM